MYVFLYLKLSANTFVCYCSMSRHEMVKCSCPGEVWCLWLLLLQYHIIFIHNSAALQSLKTTFAGPKIHMHLWVLDDAIILNIH